MSQKNDKVPHAVWSALRSIVENEELEYADNFRAYRVSDEKHYEEFKELEKNGCCGSFERIIKVKKEEWCVGCNYGH
jgi:hypothetical protein